jgi:outer membrane biosynthesis protein TonB
MSPLLHQLEIAIRLHLRNKMALLYSYLFPTIFLVAFWVLYRFEQVPLVRHMGELLTVTALGGACFGLPTTMVSERERGVWRRYRLAPVSTGTLVSGTVAARFLLLIIAGLLQLLLALWIGMPFPRHPLELLIAFTCVSFAFIGLGLVIAMMADNVPAVQALGQCIFLPMLIIGGVAVPLASLPDWAQRLSSFLPGRYAVHAIQSCVNGNGLADARFSVAALLAIGAAGSLAGAMMFRWDAQQRFATAHGKGWVAVALAAWVVVGLSAESGRRAARPSTATADNQAVAPPPSQPIGSPSTPKDVAEPPPATRPADPVPPAPRREETEPATPPSPAKPTPSEPLPSVAAVPASPPPSSSPAPPAESPSGGLIARAGKPATWRDVTMDDIERDLIFTRLPPDEGVVTPIARADEEPDAETAAQLEKMRLALADWKPGKVSDPVQRVRNLLFVVAVPDVFQMQELERFLPYVVYERIQAEIPKDDLVKILYWIATHPFDGDDSAVDQLRPLGLFSGPADMETTRDRLSVYAVKLLGRLTGKIAAGF